MPAPPIPLRLAEPLAALSLASDLARGHSQDEALRATSVAMSVARAMQLPPEQLDTVYYGTLLRYVGCTATSQQYVDTYGASDITVRQRGDYIDVGSTREAMRFLISLGDEVSGPRRLGHFLGVLRRARTAVPEAARADCEVGAALVRQFGLNAAVEETVLHAFERWDGKGAPSGLRGDAIPIATRIASAAYTAVMVAELDVHLARDTVAARSGASLDPDVAACLLQGFDVVGPALATMPGSPYWRRNPIRCDAFMTTSSPRSRADTGTLPTSRARFSRGIPTVWQSWWARPLRWPDSPRPIRTH